MHNLNVLMSILNLIICIKYVLFLIKNFQKKAAKSPNIWPNIIQNANKMFICNGDVFTVYSRSRVLVYGLRSFFTRYEVILKCIGDENYIDLPENDV